MTMGAQIPVMVEKPLTACGCKKFQLGRLSNWLTFSTQHIKSRRKNTLLKSRGRHCGDIEFAVFFLNAVGPVPLVLDLHITHDRFGSSSYPSLNGHLHYPNDIDKSLNETVTDKIRKYRFDYNYNPPTVVSFMSVVVSTSGRLHSEFVWLLFLQVHRETDRFFASSGVQFTQPFSGFFPFHHTTGLST